MRNDQELPRASALHSPLPLLAYWYDCFLWHQLYGLAAVVSRDPREGDKQQKGACMPSGTGSRQALEVSLSFMSDHYVPGHDVPIQVPGKEIPGAPCNTFAQGDYNLVIVPLGCELGPVRDQQVVCHGTTLCLSRLHIQRQCDAMAAFAHRGK
jgi:hypothetical protein